MSLEKHISCECGGDCEWRGPASQTVRVQFVPPGWRGARDEDMSPVRVAPRCADRIVGYTMPRRRATDVIEALKIELASKDFESAF